MPVKPTRPPISRPVSVNCQVISCGYLRAVCLDQHRSDFWSRELDRRQLSVREQLPHLGSREEDVVVAAVRACFRRRHLGADLAPESVLEEHRLDVELVRLELV